MSYSAGPFADTLTALGAAAAIAVLLLVAGAPLLADLVGPRRRRLPGGAVGTLPVPASVESVAMSLEGAASAGAASAGAASEGVAPGGVAPEGAASERAPKGATPRVEVPVQERGSTPAGVDVPVQAGPAEQAEPVAAPEQTRRTLTVRGAAREISLPLQRTALAPVIPLQRRVSRFS
ncbi:hypothetical protein LWC33_27800 [Pseudonocardia sp. RS11V-5]|uniref:hypothetical protein n=1 Tax=Pseudonocardia terrae TaxID=2905831 RepID=UPI001E618190|nr:hypothetical protein [Pseudonocardia terrae]MCE3555244.1 hypothetical protein [Pseudonocardia terrae]